MRPVLLGPFSLLVSTWTAMNGTRHLTADTLYWLPDSDNQGQQSRPVNVYVRLFPQDQTFISPGCFFWFLLMPSRTMIQEMMPPKKYRRQEGGRGRGKCCQGQVKDRTVRGHQSTPKPHIQNQFFSWGQGLILRNCLKTEIRYLCYFC